MLVRSSQNPKFNEAIQVVQRKLNSIRFHVHGSWPLLVDDGLFGSQTELAVKGFQKYRNISVSGAIDDITIRYIEESYNRVPQIRASSRTYSNKPEYDTRGLADKYIVVKYLDMFKEVVQGVNDFAVKEMSNINKIDWQNPQSLLSRFKSFATRLDPTMQRFKNICASYTTNQSIIKSNIEKSKERITSKQPFYKQQEIRNAQSAISKAKSMIHVNMEHSAPNLRNTVIAELNSFNLMTKIDSFLKSTGLNGKIKPDALKKIKLKPIRLNGNLLFQLWNFKDIIIDIINYKEWGTEEWNKKFHKHFTELLDGIIIGFASAVLAEMAIGLAVFVTGATISAGWIAVLVAVLALAIGLVIGYILDLADISFSEYSIQGYKSIGQLVTSFR